MTVEAFAQSIVDSVRHPIVVLDEREMIAAVNTAYYEAFKTTAAETLGRSFFEVGGGVWDADELRRILRNVIPSLGKFAGLEIVRELPGIGRQMFILNGSRLQGKDNASMTLLAIENDTARWQAEVAIKQINADLQGIIANRNDELRVSHLNLNEAVLELTALNRELEAFCYSVSHDLRTPLRAIDGFSHALLESYSDKFDEQGKHYLHRIRSGTQRMGQLIDDLLTLSRVTRTEMHREQIDLSMVAEKVAAELREEEPQRDLEFSIEPGLAAACDAHLARIVVENLLRNAWKFTSKKSTARIEFASADVEGKLAFVVRDDGAGFDSKYKAKLFGAFQRLHSDREFPGTGIGLATVHRIIRRHGGEVWAEGAEGKGASFYFTLPQGDQRS
jgi:light-regulated signal transduction histidine kinase (bacteriophytochrome)